MSAFNIEQPKPTPLGRTFGERVYRFYARLRSPRPPPGIRVMNPYADRRVRAYVRAFVETYFADNQERVLVFGINPGRFGAGITGITFTDPIALADYCGVPNHLPRVRELSSAFIYQFIAKYGSIGEFYQRFFLTAVSPLGFTRGGINLNYYDDRRLAHSVSPFILNSIRCQIALGGRTDHAIVLGKGTNFRFLQRLNDLHGFFQAVHALEHPRPIMQYRHRQLPRYLSEYVTLFRSLG